VLDSRWRAGRAAPFSFFSMPDPVAVNSMFARIARRYDLANRLLSGGIDLWWRARLVAAVARNDPKEVLDLATGSGDVAFALARRLGKEAKIVGMDFCQPMLDEAVAKQQRDPKLGPGVEFKQGDGLALPCAAASFDAATISFGLRNMADRDRCLRELRRVLRPGGVLHVLEFSQPYRWFAPLYYAYTRRVLPIFAGWLTGDRAAYAYLNASIEAFPDHVALAEELRRAGFKAVTVTRRTGGIVAHHVGMA
jgi:demethylmenaquinone methyltransferase / 2-methoxy-6-polyprenyl-1,4-benzoquinol methylase